MELKEVLKTSKWFKYYDGKVFCSKQKATTLDKAWEKTEEKWELINIGFISTNSKDTCGLCDLFNDNACIACPLFGKASDCVPFSSNPEKQIKWMQKVKRKSEKGEMK